MFFEVIYGAAQSLHSKFDEIMQVLFSSFNKSEIMCPIQTQVLRCIYMKLLNEVKGNDLQV